MNTKPTKTGPNTWVYRGVVIKRHHVYSNQFVLAACARLGCCYLLKNVPAWIDSILDQRIEQYRDEGDNGHWAYLKPGWQCLRSGTHAAHEETLAEVMECVLQAEPCDCDQCKETNS